MIVDRKFKFVATNPCKGNVYTEENAVVFCAKDQALPAALLAYVRDCEAIGCGVDHIKSVRLLIQRVIEYQSDIESRVPDTDGPCEISRCIDGKV